MRFHRRFRKFSFHMSAFISKLSWISWSQHNCSQYPWNSAWGSFMKRAAYQKTNNCYYLSWKCVLPSSFSCAECARRRIRRRRSAAQLFQKSVLIPIFEIGRWRRRPSARLRRGSRTPRNHCQQRGMRESIRSKRAAAFLSHLAGRGAWQAGNPIFRNGYSGLLTQNRWSSEIQVHTRVSNRCLISR